MDVKRKTIVFAGSPVLGNRILSEQYLKALRTIGEVDVLDCSVAPDSFAKYPLPFWKKELSSILDAVHVTGLAVRDRLEGRDVDAAFLVGFEAALACPSLIKKVPVVLIQDTTPALAQQLIRNLPQPLSARLRSVFLGALTSAWCRRVFRGIACFLPISQWCADSLVRDYGVPAERVTAVYPALDLARWTAAKIQTSGQPRLLFIGNDFKRKGGDFLLNMYQSRLRERCGLTVISNDPVLKEAVPQGVEVVSDVPHEAVAAFFQQADVFVFPTTRDQLPLVLTEALASGLPVIARDVGGIRDVVKDGYNGYLMPYESPEEVWVHKIQYLLDHPEERARMGANSRTLAEELFSLEKFEKIVRDVVLKLIVKINRDRHAFIK